MTDLILLPFSVIIDMFSDYRLTFILYTFKYFLLFFVINILLKNNKIQDITSKIKNQYSYYFAFAIIFIFKIISAFSHQRPEGFSRYFETLKNYGWDFIKFSNIKPLFVDLYFYFWVKIIPQTVITEFNFFLWLHGLLNIASVYLLYKVLMQLKANKLYIFLIIIYYSLYLIPFENYRSSETYDHFTIFCSCLFIFCINRFVNAQSLKHAFQIGLSSSFLIWQSTVNMLIAPLVTTITFIHIFSSKKLKSNWLKSITLAILPSLFSIFILVGKNYYYTGLKSTSILGGPCLMLVVQQMFGLNQKVIRQELVKADAPDWYLWCYDNRVIPKDEKGVPYPGWDINSVAYGICSDFSLDLKNADSPYPFNFEPLREKIREFDQPEILASLEKDIKNSYDNKYLFNTIAPEATSFWLVRHGQESMKLAKKIIINNLSSFAETFVRMHRIFHSAGPGYMGTEAMNHVSSKKLKKNISKPIFLVSSLLFRTTYLIIWLLIIFSPIAIYLNIKGKFKKIDIYYYALPAFFGGIIFNSFSGAENHRYYLQISPYLVVTGGVLITIIINFLEDLLEKVLKRIKQRDS